jgi:pimeloyl-ACP methyl ester carboxylesterase
MKILQWKITVAAATALVVPLAWFGCALAQSAPARQTSPSAQPANRNPAMQTRASQTRMGAAIKQNGQAIYATVNGMRLFYRVSGHGEPLLLIHGYPLNDKLFMRVRPMLAKHYKVITPDLPGFGRSQAKSNNASLQMYAKAMFGLMDKLHIKKAVIGGHSMGGMTVVEMYKMHPNRFDGMILIDTAAIAAPQPRKMLWKGYAKLGHMSSSKRDKIATMLLPGEMLSGQTRMHNKQVVSEAKKMIDAASSKGFIGGGNALANRPNNHGVLKKAHVPTLILVGEQDPITPIAIAMKMHKAIKGSKMDVVKGGSHLEILEKPKEAGHDIMQWTQQSQRNQTRTASRAQ